MNRLTAAVRSEYPPEFETSGFLKGVAFTAVPLQQLITGDLRPALLVLSGAVGLVLLIACVNLANLLLARASTRPREMAVRLALGSSRGRVLQQTLTESVVWAFPGGLAGVAVTWLAVRTLNASKPTVLAPYPPIEVDFRVLLFSLALTFVTGMVFGMAPALAAVGTRIQEALKSAGYSQSRGPSASRFRRLLVVAELSVSLVLLIGSGLLARSFLNLAHVPLGFSADRLLTFRVRLSPGKYTTAQGETQYFKDVLDRLTRIPSVRSAALASNIPLSNDFYGGFTFQVEGRPKLPLADYPDTNSVVVSPEFFHTMGIPLRSGSLFDTGPRGADQILVNEAFARKFFPGEDPIGRTLDIGARQDLHWTVIGIVGDIRTVTLGAEPAPLAYRYARETGRDMGLVVETNADPRSAIAAVEQQVHTVDPDQPMVDVKTMDQRVDDALSPERFSLILIGTFAAIAVILAAAGVYGVMSYLVARRTREIGIRIAMGASPAAVVRLILGESLALSLLAIAVGLGGAWWLTSYVESLLYGVVPLDAATFAATSAILALIVAAASLGPAYRASQVDPIHALQEE
jgi:putative ABC transport system permease protein